MSGGGPGEEHAQKTEPICECDPAGAVRCPVHLPTGDPFSAADTPARRAFIDALNALAKTTVRRFPGGGDGDRPDEERRRDDRAIVEACGDVLRTAGWWTGDMRAKLKDAEAATERARRERDAAEKDRGAAKRREETDVEIGTLRSRVADLEADVAAQVTALIKTINSWQDATGCVCPEDATKARNMPAEALREELRGLNSVIDAWQQATGCSCPDDASDARAAADQARAERDAAERDRAALRSRVADLEAEILVWRKVTWSETPDDAGAAIEGRVKELERGIAAACASRETLRLRVLDLEAEITAWRAHPASAPDPGRTWVERAEARLVALEAKVSPENEMPLSGIRVQCEELYAHIFREGGMGEQHADLLKRVDVLERELATSVEARTDARNFQIRDAIELREEIWGDNGLRARLDALESRLAPKPDTLSEECQRIQAERDARDKAWDPVGGRPIVPDPVAAIRDLAAPNEPPSVEEIAIVRHVDPPRPDVGEPLFRGETCVTCEEPSAEPSAGEVWEDEDDGERVRLVENNGRHGVVVEVVRSSPSSPGKEARCPIGSRRSCWWPLVGRWRRVTEQEPRVGEMWEDSEDGERVRVSSVGSGGFVATVVVRGRNDTYDVGREVLREFGATWRCVPEQEARAERLAAAETPPIVSAADADELPDPALGDIWELSATEVRYAIRLHDVQHWILSNASMGIEQHVTTDELREKWDFISRGNPDKIQDAWLRRRVRDEVAALCEAVGWGISECMSPHPTPAEQTALAGLERLAAQVDGCPGRLGEKMARQPAGDERADPTPATRVEMAARAALREEVAALCDEARWSGCAAGIRNGKPARIYLHPRPVATTEVARNALAALDALAETEKSIVASGLVGPRARKP